MVRETEIERADHSRVTVRTDSKGTQDIHDDGRTGTTSGSDRHKEHVERYTREGRRILRERSD